MRASVGALFCAPVAVVDAIPALARPPRIVEWRSRGFRHAVGVVEWRSYGLRHAVGVMDDVRDVGVALVEDGNAAVYVPGTEVEMVPGALQRNRPDGVQVLGESAARGPLGIEPGAQFLNGDEAPCDRLLGVDLGQGMG